MKTWKVLLSAVVVALLSGCSEGPPASHAPELTFANLQPLTMNASRIEVVRNYRPSSQAPYADYSFRTPLVETTEKLLQSQLVAGGTENTLRAIIDDASVIREAEPVPTNMTNLFTQPSETLKARVLVRFELVRPEAPDIILGHARVVAVREKSFSQELSPAARENQQYTLTKTLMDDVYKGLQSSVQNTFGRK